MKKVSAVGRGLLIALIGMFINGFVFWLAWTYVLRVKFDLPVLTIWDCAVLVIGLRALLHVNKTTVVEVK